MTYLIAFIASAFVLCFCIYLLLKKEWRVVDEEIMKGEKEAAMKKLANTKTFRFEPEEKLTYNQWQHYLRYKN